MFLLAIILSSLTVTHSVKFNEKTLVWNYVFGRYYRFIEPSDPQLRFGLSILCAQGGQNGQPVLASVIEKYTWNDNRFVWAPRFYDGIQQITVSDSQVWKPNMKLYNSFSSLESRDPSDVGITYNGTVVWFPRAQYKTHCYQGRCQYNFGHWTHNSSAAAAQIWSNEPVDFHYDSLSCPLKIASVSNDLLTNVDGECLETPRSIIRYNVTFVQEDLE